jgi:hypothetical protein
LKKKNWKKKKKKKKKKIGIPLPGADYVAPGKKKRSIGEGRSKLFLHTIVLQRDEIHCTCAAKPAACCTLLFFCFL